jgi:hypothetical protein
MRYQYFLALILASLWGPLAHGSVSEQEPNSTVAGFGVFYQTQLFGYTREFDLTGNFNDTANLDPSRANPLSINDELVGQLGGTRDYDWFYVDVPDSSRPVTPIYFGCDQKQGFYQEVAPGNTLSIDPTEDISYQVNYYYQENSTAAVSEQSSYVIGPDSCRIASGETIGHFRFQMNTQRPGRYLVRIFGRRIDTFKVEDEVTTGFNADGTKITDTRQTFYDEIVTPTGDYSLRVYTSRIAGEMEPNDGSVEAFPLVSGTSTSGQLASQYDQDWFYIDNDAAKNAAGKIPFYFTCKNQSSAIYNLSSFDEKGVLQTSYSVPSAQCSAAGGYLFTIDAPASARYYFVVTPPTFDQSASFSQSDYSVLAIVNNSGVSGTTVRLPGELEPNDTPVNAVPLADTVPVIAQLSAVTDLDYYFYVNSAPGPVPINFVCQAGGEIYTLSTFNAQGFLQKAYTVTGDQCSAEGGFQFTIDSADTPVNTTTYILVAGPPGNDTTTFSSADYTLTAYVNLAAQGTPNAEGTLNTGTITDSTAASKDSFAVNVKGCGTKKGAIKLTGRKLNLVGPHKNTAVKVQIGSWSCVSNAQEFSIPDPDPNPTTFVFPKPPPPPAKKTKGIKISGGG